MSYEKSTLASDAERDLKFVRELASEMHYGALPRAWQHVYNLLIELDRAYMSGKYDARLEAEERAKIDALPMTPETES